jgi:DNA-directed RNA polymerase specialized sigma24 family protein
MEPSGTRGSLTADGFARLLERLHPDAVQAAHEYERLRRGLLKFFDWRGIWPPDECADDVLDRFARKVEVTAVQDVSKYIYGIARLVALERRRGPSFAPLDDAPPSVLSTPPATDDDRNPLHECFERCLAHLPEDARSLLLRYYEGERSSKIENRRRLAALLGVTDNALRSRVQRLRERLERCMQECSAQTLSLTS